MCRQQTSARWTTGGGFRGFSAVKQCTSCPAHVVVQRRVHCDGDTGRVLITQWTTIVNGASMFKVSKYRRGPGGFVGAWSTNIRATVADAHRQIAHALFVRFCPLGDAAATVAGRGQVGVGLRIHFTKVVIT